MSRDQLSRQVETAVTPSVVGSPIVAARRESWSDIERLFRRAQRLGAGLISHLI